MAEKNKKNYFIFLATLLFVVGGFFYFRYQVYYSHGSYPGEKIIKIEKGEGNKIIGERLEKERLVSGKYFFYYYMWSRKSTGRILPGEYKLSGSLTIPEIALMITEEKGRNIKITFPEGWTAEKMAARLTANGLSGEEFLKLAGNPGELKSDYEFLNDPEVKSLEGYLFPDTYFFTREMNAEAIARKMLGIFNTKVTPQMKEETFSRGRSLHEIIIMASIIEGEVRTDEDRKIVSGIFWNRLENGKRLQSCATIAYVLGEKKKQYSESETQTSSPYNTYLNQGLPPAPISNPGLSAIEAAIYPIYTDYNYFLSDLETGGTIFSKTYEEHVANKAKYGL